MKDSISGAVSLSDVIDDSSKNERAGLYCIQGTW